MIVPSIQQERTRIRFLWLLRLRWFAFLGQLATIAVARYGFNLELDYAVLIAISSAFGLSNAIAERVRVERPRFPLEGAALLLDTAFLTALLAFSGGPANPFSALYLVHIVLALMILSERWAWGLTAFTLGCFGFLFFFHREIPHFHSHENMAAHFQGMWVAMGITSTIIVYFVRRILQGFSDLEKKLEESREALLRHEKLRSLGTLAAGAAHELSTPLSTIALVSQELLSQTPLDGQKKDLTLIRSEVDRCKAVLSRFSANLGHPQGEPLREVRLEDFVQRLEGSDGISVRISPGLSSRSVRLPAEAVRIAIQNLLNNAIDARRGAVSMDIARTNGSLVFSIVDDGPGMDADALRRVGEPFYTTKETGKGMGLGVFLSRSIAEQLGGTLRFESSPAGTRAIFSIPTEDRHG